MYSAITYTADIALASNLMFTEGPNHVVVRFDLKNISTLVTLFGITLFELRLHRLVWLVRSSKEVPRKKLTEFVIKLSIFSLILIDIIKSL